MKNWRVKRNGELLGHFIADEVVLIEGVLLAKRHGKIIGSIASGSGLTWEEIPFLRDDA